MPKNDPDWKLFNLAGRNAFVTGGGGLLGPEHGAGLARCGATVVLADIDKSKLNAARKRLLLQVPDAKVETIGVDITDESALVAARKKLESSGLAIDILINNAALNPKMDQKDDAPSGAIETYDTAFWRQELNVGITGPFLCAKVFGGAMAERGAGVIINIASDLAILAPDQRIYAKTGAIEDVRNFKPIGYCVVKSALLGLNRYLATYWAHRNVRSNCLAPGGVFNNQPDHLVEQVKHRIPMGRWAKPSEYQGAIAFLASDASAYMTGQVLIMDGGRSIW